ncbi:DUF6087 family protein [Streptomyces sp. NPDC018057]|uniref:DUF6087 family protein n=1 Tax=unclassified Streptomyces TaxID=2593676 RepID=UPI0037AB4648
MDAHPSRAGGRARLAVRPRDGQRRLILAVPVRTLEPEREPFAESPVPAALRDAKVDSVQFRVPPSFHLFRPPVADRQGPLPEAPRAIQRWNGHLWEPHGFAANLAEARLILFPRTEAEAEAGAAPAPAATPRLGPGTGGHRKPPAP